MPPIRAPRCRTYAVPVTGKRSRRLAALCLVGGVGVGAGGTAFAAPTLEEPWRLETTSDGSAPVARHEATGVAVNGRMYLLGGRSDAFGQQVDVYDPVARTWTSVAPMPTELHHFQAVAVGSGIWVVGAFTGAFPDEVSVADIHVFDTGTLTWRIAGQVPEARRRGSAGAALHDDGFIYVHGGNTRGHNGGAVAWLDRFDPATLAWEALPDGPHPRDHFGMAILDGLVVVAGGRATALPDVTGNTVLETDVYSPVDGTWSASADIPTSRAGAFTVGHDGEMIVAGGETSADESALARVEAWSVDTGSWRVLQPLSAGRHAGGMAVLEARMHVVAGSPTRGGGNTSTHQSLGLGTASVTDPVPDPDPDPVTDPGPVTSPDPVPDTDPEPGTNPDPDPSTNPVPDTSPEPAPDTNTDTDTDTDAPPGRISVGKRGGATGTLLVGVLAMAVALRRRREARTGRR